MGKRCHAEPAAFYRARAAAVVDVHNMCTWYTRGATAAEAMRPSVARGGARHRGPSVCGSGGVDGGDEYLNNVNSKPPLT